MHDRMCFMHQSSLLKFTYYQLRQSFKECCKVFHFPGLGEGLLMLNWSGKQIEFSGEKSSAVSKITRNNAEKCRGLDTVSTLVRERNKQNKIIHMFPE